MFAWVTRQWVGHGVSFAGCLLLALLISLILASPAQAATGINQQINYQARLLDNTGAVVPDGAYNMEFKIYQDGDGVLSGGDETLKWTETRTGGNKVTVKNGYFSVQLGSITAFSTNVDWNQDTLWLSTNIGGTGTPTWDGEMSPFRRLGSAAYSFNSNRLGGLTASEFLQLAPGNVQTDSTTNNSIYVNKTGGSGNILQLQKNGSGVLTIANSGTVTIGTADNNATLFVLDIKNDSGDPGAATEGAMYYNDSANKFRCYQNTGWTDCIGTGGGGYATIQDETSPLTQRSVVNFTGAGVSCVDNAGSSATDCTINGGGGSTLQNAYDAGSAGDQVITLDDTQDSFVLRNPDTSGSDSTYVLTLEQLEDDAGTRGGLYIKNSGAGHSLLIEDVVSDNTPFIVDGDGRVGIGTTSVTGSTERLLQVGSLTNRGNAAIYGDVVSEGMTDITGLTGIKDIFLYDTTADSDGGRWIDWATTDQLSWYTEALDDGPSDPCNIATDDRCYTSAFPRKAVIVVTTDAMYIFDAATNDLWMKFSQNAAGWALGADTSNDPTSVTAVNGVIYVGTNGSSQGGLYVFDFVNDRMWNIDGTDRSGADVGISGRNAAVTYNSDNNTAFDLSVTGTAAEWEDINDVSATYVSSSSTAISTGAATNTSPGSGQTFVALATDSGITVINMTAQKLLQYSDVTADDYTSVALTKRGRLYALNTTSDQAEMWLNFDTDKASEVNGTFDARYDETVGPALWTSTPNIIAGAPDALEVIERGSLADDTSDILYVGHSLGLTEIHTHSTTTNGWSKFFDTTRQTMLMPNAIDMALMLDDTSGTLAQDISFNNTDMSIFGSPTMAVSGVRGKALQFDNSNDFLCSDADQNATCDVDASFNMSTTGWTMSMWFRHSPTAPASGADTLFEKCVTATPAQAIGCVVAYMTTTGTIVVANDDDATWTRPDVGAASYDITSTSSLTYNDNQWHQLVITRTNANDVDTFIDGNPLNLSTATGNTLTLDGSQIVTIGASCSTTTGANCAAANAVNFWDGVIDDVTFSNGTTTVSQLSALQVRRLYNDARPLVTKRVINVTDATSASSTTIADSGEAWIPNEFAGMFVTLAGGTGAGQTRRISSNTATTLTVTPAFQTTPDTTTDFEIDPEALYGSSNAVYGIGITGENPLGQARQMCIGTNNGSDGGGVTCYNHQAGPNLIADLFHGDSKQTDDAGTEWAGTDYDDIRSIDMSGRTLLVGSEAHIYTETGDVRLGQALDYIGNQLFNIRAELINDGITLTGSQALEVGFTGGADLAERYASAETLSPGDVVALTPNNVGAVQKTTTAYQSDMLGIVATEPGLLIGTDAGDASPIALVGRVPVKVTTENGAIKAGDRLTSASIPGYAMKATHAGRVLGTVLDDLGESAYIDCPETVSGDVRCGTVTVFVNLVDYTGQSVALAVKEAEADGLLTTETIFDPASGLVAGSLSDAERAAQTDKITRADKILRYLTGRQNERSSEVLADQVSAVDIHGANLYAKNAMTLDFSTGGLTVGSIATFNGESFFNKLVIFAEKTVFKNDLTLEGHLATAGHAPSTQLEPAAAPGGSAAIEGNDTAGQFTITTGQDPTAGLLLTINFAKPFTKPPRVLLTPINDNASQLVYYIQSTPNGFSLVASEPPKPDASSSFNYWVAE